MNFMRISLVESRLGLIRERNGVMNALTSARQFGQAASQANSNWSDSPSGRWSIFPPKNLGGPGPSAAAEDLGDRRIPATTTRGI